MTQIKFRPLSNVNFFSQIWTIANQQTWTVNCFNWWWWNLENDFWLIVQWSINHYWSTIFLINYDTLTNSSSIYNFDIIDWFNTENWWNKSMWLKKDWFIYQFFVPSVSSNRKMYIRRFIVWTTANASWVFKLERDVAYWTLITWDNYTTTTTVTANLNYWVKMIKHSWYFIICVFWINNWITTNTITFDVANNINIVNHNLIASNSTWIETQNMMNFDSYFLVQAKFSTLTMFTLTWTNINNIWNVSHYLNWREVTRNSRWQYNKLKQSWKYITESWAFFWYYNAWSLTLQATSLSRNWNWLDNSVFPIRLDSSVIFKWLLTTNWSIVDNNLNWPNESLLPVINTWISRVEHDNDTYTLLLNSWNLYTFQITESWNAVNFVSTWYIETKDYVVTAWFAKCSFSAIENLNWQTANYQVSFDSWATRTWITLNSFLTLPTTPYPSFIRLKVTLSTTNVTQTSQVDKINFLLHN